LILFKSDKDKFNDELNKAFSDRNKGNLEGAVKHFLNAYEIASKSSDPDINKRAGEVLFYATFYDALLKKTPETFSKAAELCRKLDPTLQLDIGIAAKPTAGELARDLELTSMIFSLPRFNISDAGKMDESVARKYEEVGNILIGEGARRLILEDLLNIHDPLSVVGLRLLGYARVIRALKIEADSPSRAVELYSEALAYLQQATPEIRNFVSERLGKLSKTTKCWVCHREIQGEEINYIYLPASVNNYIREKYGSEASFLISDGKIAVCRVCYTMVYNLSDALAKQYYELAMKALQEVEARLNARISSLELRVSAIRVQVGRR
jgi:tetratricopeptide (TPR) repeat protein